MIVAAALVENKTGSLISEHFGRCKWYGLYNTKTGAVQFIENTYSQSTSNAGLLAAELVLEYNVSMVIAGRFGFKVADKFKANNVQMIIPQNGQAWNYFISLLKKNK